MTQQAPLIKVHQDHFPGAAITTDLEQALFEAPYDGTVTAVSFIPDAAITGVNTNTRKLEVFNRGQAGLGTNVLASIQFNSGTNGVAFDELPLVLGTGPTVAVLAGDVISVKSTHILTGLADPGGDYRVEFTRA